MEDEKILSVPVQIYAGILLILVFLLGTVGNILLIITFTLYSKLRGKIFHLLLFSISVFALIIDILCVPTLGLHMIKYWPKWPFTKPMCTLVSFLANTGTSMMVVTLLMFSIDRYYVIVRKKMLTQRTVLMIILVLLIISASLHGSYIFPLDLISTDSNGTNYSICNNLDGEILNETVGPALFSATVIHGLLMVTSSLLLGISSIKWWQVKTTELGTPSTAVGYDLKAAIVISLACFGFWLPYWILLVFRTHEKTTVKMVVISFVLSLITTTIPPVTAVLLLKNIRKAFLDLMRGCKRADECLCISRRNHQGDGDPLTQDTLWPIKATTHRFVKGNFKRGTKKVMMDNVSISSSEFSSTGSQGHDNNSYDDLTELHPHLESRF